MDAGLTPQVILLLALVAAAAGWVDAVSGGGGLLQLPALLLATPDRAPAYALGTNKIASIAGTASAAIAYSRRIKPELATALPMAIAAFVGAAGGARLAGLLPVEVMRPLIIVALATVWLLIALRPQWGRESTEPRSRRRHTITALAGGAGIGFYDGILGPGTGAFLIVLLVGALGYSFLRASATAKIVNVGTNLAAIVVFGLAGTVLWGVGLLMAVCNVAGAVVGARTAIARGSGFVRIVLLVVVAVLLATLAWQTLAA
jgi:uncharacterized membrane protein YfcA